jgi:hypothetical protein
MSCQVDIHNHETAVIGFVDAFPVGIASGRSKKPLHGRKVGLTCICDGNQVKPGRVFERGPSNPIPDALLCEKIHHFSLVSLIETDQFGGPCAHPRLPAVEFDRIELCACN